MLDGTQSIPGECTITLVTIVAGKNDMIGENTCAVRLKTQYVPVAILSRSLSIRSSSASNFFIPIKDELLFIMDVLVLYHLSLSQKKK